tara:strand:- start:1561 stop:1899 length:339 start_codon:yes stop_codon:yes gene_type:complete
MGTDADVLGVVPHGTNTTKTRQIRNVDQDQDGRSTHRTKMRSPENKLWRLEPMSLSKYEIKGQVVPLGAGLRTSGYVVLQDGHYKQFFETLAEAQQAAKTWADTEKERECCE